MVLGFRQNPLPHSENGGFEIFRLSIPFFPYYLFHLFRSVALLTNLGNKYKHFQENVKLYHLLEDDVELDGAQFRAEVNSWTMNEWMTSEKISLDDPRDLFEAILTVLRAR